MCRSTTQVQEMELESPQAKEEEAFLVQLTKQVHSHSPWVITLALHGKPVHFQIDTGAATEQQYAQIEEKALAFTWACERFSDYLPGLTFHIHTDYKTLVPLFSTKNLDELPIRVQRFRLRMMRYNFTISHVPGKSMFIADTFKSTIHDSC